MDIWLFKEGLDVYSEIHKNDANILVHVIFMPLVAYSILRGIPSLLNLNKKYMIHMVNLIHLAYVLYYFTFDQFNAISMAILYSPVLMLAKRDYQRGLKNFMKCFMILATTLVIQEVLGHSIYEKTNSRPGKYIINAIMYAPIFSAYHTTKYFIQHWYQMSIMYVLILFNFF